LYFENFLQTLCNSLIKKIKESPGVEVTEILKLVCYVFGTIAMPDKYPSAMMLFCIFYAQPGSWLSHHQQLGAANWYVQVGAGRYKEREATDGWHHAG